MTSTINSLWPLLHPLSHPTITLDVLPHKPFLGSKDGLLTDTAQVCNCSVSCLSSAPPLFPNHPHRHPFLPHLLSDLKLFPGCVKVCFQIHLFSLLTTTPANRLRQCLTSTRPDPDSNTAPLKMHGAALFEGETELTRGPRRAPKSALMYPAQLLNCSSPYYDVTNCIHRKFICLLRLFRQFQETGRRRSGLMLTVPHQNTCFPLGACMFEMHLHESFE